MACKIVKLDEISNLNFAAPTFLASHKNSSYGFWNRAHKSLTTAMISRGLVFVDVLISVTYAKSHYNDVIRRAMASQITGVSIVYSTVYSGADQRKHQCSALLAFVRVILLWPADSPHKGPITRKMFSFHDVIMQFGRMIDACLAPCDIFDTYAICVLDPR